MALDSANLGLASAGLPLLRDLIHERTGLYYDDGRLDSLIDRLAPLVLERGFRSFLDFYYLLKYDDRESTAEWRQVLNALSVAETYFWREVEQIHSLSRVVLPALLEDDPTRTIRIWSVPCASGEEPLTIAMMLNEDGWFARAKIEIHGSDGSSAAVERARQGLYRERSFRALPAHLRAKYFVSRDGVSSPTEQLRDRITSWTVVNLMEAHGISQASSPVIFCRNAFIYFSAHSVKTVVEALASRMPSPSYLFVGASESLLRVTDRFTLDTLDRAFVYIKR